MPKIWLTQSEIDALPTSGAAYADVLKVSESSWGTCDIHDSNYVHNMGTLAGALIAAKSKNAATLGKTRQALAQVPGTEMGAQEGGQQPSLAVSRKLHSYIIAADLIDYREAAFLNWAKQILGKKLGDGKSVREIHEKRPNNWGTMAFASRVATDLYIGDTVDIKAAVYTFRAWLGDQGAPSHAFDWGDMSWQADKTKPVGINRKGAKLTVDGGSRNVDGVQPEDQRRTGFQWPPAKGNYPWGALGPILIGLELLRHSGQDLRAAGDSAVARSAQWLYGTGANPPSGDDAWQPSLLGFLYPALNWPGGTLAEGKNFGYTQWTHGSREASGAPTPPPTEPPVTADPCKAQRDKVAQAQASLDQAKKALADCEAANP